MTRSTLAQKQDRTTSETRTDPTEEPEATDLIYHQSTTGSFRRFLLATGAILLSITINLGLLAFIGYVDNAQSSSSPNTPQTAKQTITVQQMKDVEANKSVPSKDQQKKKRPSAKTIQKPLPEPQPVAKAQPLKLNNVTSNFDVEPPRVPLRTSAGTELHSDQLDQTTGASSGASGTREGSSFQSGELDRLPRKIGGPDPVYPLEAKQNRTTGYVLLELDVSREGTVSNVEVLDWSGSPKFKQSAKKAVRKWTFEPGRRNDSPVDARNLRQRIRFELVGD